MDEAACSRGESDQPHRGVLSPTLPEAMQDTAGVTTHTPMYYDLKEPYHNP
jgi:hypothetical protein